MTQWILPVSASRQRMLDDMRLRTLSPKTQTGYIGAVKGLAGYLGRSPDGATVEDLRRLQLHLVDHGTSPITLNATITGHNFLFEATLDRPEAIMTMMKNPQNVGGSGGVEGMPVPGSRRMFVLVPKAVEAVVRKPRDQKAVRV